MFILKVKAKPTNRNLPSSSLSTCDTQLNLCENMFLVDIRLRAAHFSRLSAFCKRQMQIFTDPLFAQLSEQNQFPFSYL